MRLQSFRLHWICHIDEMAPVGGEKGFHFHVFGCINKIYKFLSNYLQFSFLSAGFMIFRATSSHVILEESACVKTQERVTLSGVEGC
jgi:hypothetical protein